MFHFHRLMVAASYLPPKPGLRAQWILLEILLRKHSVEKHKGQRTALYHVTSTGQNSE